MVFVKFVYLKGRVNWVGVVVWNEMVLVEDMEVFDNW